MYPQSPAAGVALFDVNTIRSDSPAASAIKEPFTLSLLSVLKKAVIPGINVSDTPELTVIVSTTSTSVRHVAFDVI